MESYRLNSRVVENEKEFLIQTSNDTRQSVVNSSVFVNGELLDSVILPYAEHITEDQMLSLVKTTHGEKKAELEYLLKNFQQILQQGQPKMMYLFGSALFFRRMFSEARTLFRTAVKLNENLHEAWFFLSQTELALKDIEQAKIAGTRAVELKPEFADYRNNLGEAYLAAESCKRAAMEFQIAVDKNVYYADAYFNLAMAYLKNGIKKEDFEMASELPDKCLDLFGKAVLIYPEYESSEYAGALTAVRNGEYKKAFMLFLVVRTAKKEKLRHKNAAHFNRFLIYTDWLSEQHISDRVKYLEAEISRNPDYVDLYHELGVCLLHQARFSWRKGTEYFDKALSINQGLRKAQRAKELSADHFLKLTDAISDIADASGMQEE